MICRNPSYDRAVGWNRKEGSASSHNDSESLSSKSNVINLSTDLQSQQSTSQHHNKVVFRQPKLLLTASLLQMQPALLPSASHALESLLFHPSPNKADGATEK